MAKLDRNFVDSKVRYLFAQAGKQAEMPADLRVLARFQKVHVIDRRPMIPSGGLAYRDEGFVVYIRDVQLDRPVPYLVSEEEELPRLTPRQRFTCAHEIAHTFFFNFGPPLTKIEGYPSTKALEQLCQYGARQILLPQALLSKALAGGNALTASFICELADRFVVSPEAVVRRLAEPGTVEYSSPSLLMARDDRKDNDATIVATFVDPALIVHFRRPETFSSLADWAGDLLQGDFWKSATWQGTIQLNGSEVSLKKVPYRSNTFFLEIEVA